jgi:hypothetical protein
MAVVTVTAKVTAQSDIVEGTIMINGVAPPIPIPAGADPTTRQVNFTTDDNGIAIFALVIQCRSGGVAYQLTLTKLGSSTPKYTSPAGTVTGPDGTGVLGDTVDFS